VRLIDLMLLKTFVGVAEIGSISAAAPLLGCSQPGLSQRVQALERRLGCRLFHRGPTGVRLTVVGAAVLPLAQVMLDTHRQMLIEIERHCPEPDPKPPDSDPPWTD
jgi:DNA-binding transcriptional LysR family regulator